MWAPSQWWDFLLFSLSWRESGSEYVCDGERGGGKTEIEEWVNRKMGNIEDERTKEMEKWPQGVSKRGVDNSMSNEWLSGKMLPQTQRPSKDMFFSLVHGECCKVLTLRKQERALKCSLDTTNGSLTCCSLFCYSDDTCIFWRLETNVFGLSSWGSLEFFWSVSFHGKGHWRMQEKQITACYLPLRYNSLTSGAVSHGLHGIYFFSV